MVDDVASRILILIPLWLSLSVHEWAHAWSAFRLGDDTAARMGRMTINPLRHIDPVGTFLLPMLGVPFGWAKPVPINPLNFRPDVKVSTGVWVTAAAGPISNVVLAAACIVLLAACIVLAPQSLLQNEAVPRTLQRLIAINVVLAVFNMLPIPPLDGSRVAEALMPVSLRPAWRNFARLAPLMLLAVLFLPVTQPLFRAAFAAANWLLWTLVGLFGGSAG